MKIANQKRRKREPPKISSTRKNPRKDILELCPEQSNKICTSR
jgi:hypothetical protein